MRVRGAAGKNLLPLYRARRCAMLSKAKYDSLSGVGGDGGGLAAVQDCVSTFVSATPLDIF